MPRQKDPFDFFVAGVDSSASIDDLADRFKTKRLLTPELEAELIDAGLKMRIRRAINRDRLPNGLPRLAAVPEQGDADRQLWLYKPHEQLDVGNFVNLWKAAQRRRRRAEDVQAHWEKEFEQRFPDERPLRQLALTWGAPRKKGDGAEGVA